MGRQLPDDYKQLIDTYGAGAFDVLRLFSPVDADPQYHIQEHSIVAREMYRRLFEESVYYTADLHPEPDALLPWAMLEDGWLCWIADDAPDDWIIVYVHPRNGDYREYHRSTTSLIVAYLKGELREYDPPVTTLFTLTI
jgi:hypothetical protein